MEADVITKYKLLSQHVRPEENQLVRLKVLGNITEIQSSSSSPSSKSGIRKLSKEYYRNDATGEVLKFHHTSCRGDNIDSLRKTFRHLGDILFNNVTNPEHALWISLTYDNDMTDNKRLSDDTANFFKKLRRRYGDFEYIIVPEPQGRGAWHAHAVLIFNDTAPYIPKSEMASVWGHGSVSVKKVSGIDGIVKYLTSYLRDLPLDEATDLTDSDIPNLKDCKVKEVQITLDNGKIATKKIFKNGRLHLYPPGIRLIRCSSGIKRPSVEYKPAFEAEEYVADAELVYETTFEISNADTGFKAVLNRRRYNTERKP